MKLLASVRPVFICLFRNEYLNTPHASLSQMWLVVPYHCYLNSATSAKKRKVFVTWMAKLHFLGQSV